MVKRDDKGKHLFSVYCAASMPDQKKRASDKRKAGVRRRKRARRKAERLYYDTKGGERIVTATVKPVKEFTVFCDIQPFSSADKFQCSFTCEDRELARATVRRKALNWLKRRGFNGPWRFSFQKEDGEERMLLQSCPDLRIKDIIGYVNR